jgi:hypothetical protein
MDTILKSPLEKHYSMKRRKREEGEGGGVIPSFFVWFLHSHGRHVKFSLQYYIFYLHSVSISNVASSRYSKATKILIKKKKRNQNFLYAMQTLAEASLNSPSISVTVDNCYLEFLKLAISTVDPPVSILRVSSNSCT